MTAYYIRPYMAIFSVLHFHDKAEIRTYPPLGNKSGFFCLEQPADFEDSVRKNLKADEDSNTQS